MYSFATLPLGDFNNAVSIKVSGRATQIVGKRRTQRVLRTRIGVGVERDYSNTTLGSSPPNPSGRAITNTRRDRRDRGLQGYLAPVGNKNRTEENITVPVTGVWQRGAGTDC